MTDLAASAPAATLRRFDRRRWTALAVPVLILAYLAYAAAAFDLGDLAGRARWDNARTLLGDFWSYKTHVTRDNRSGRLTVAIEGEAKGTYPPGRLPDWVQQAGDVTTIDLGGGNVVTYDAAGARYAIAGVGTLAVTPAADGTLTLSGPRPEGVSVSDNKITVTTRAGRFSYSRAKVETWRYFAGWELFFWQGVHAWRHFSGRDVDRAALRADLLAGRDAG